MDVRPIRTDEDHIATLKEIDRLWQAEPGTPEGDKLDVLIALVSAYEDEHYPIPEVDPVDILHYAIEDLGRSQADLARILGSRSRASEILSRKRSLTLDMIRAISEAWRLPIEVLARPYRLERETA